MKNSQNVNKNTMPGAGPFYFGGNKTGILLIHGGGGGTCADLKPLAEYLHEEGGYTVHVPLLPGYGTSPEDLEKTPVSAWKEAVESEFKALKKKCDKVIVGGHSLGGVLTIIFASKNN